MKNKIEEKILNYLLDRYEKSKSFLGENKLQQNFKLAVAKVFPKYEDDADYAFYSELNASVQFLESQNFIRVEKERSGKIKAIFLNSTSVNDIYTFLNRTPKKSKNQKLLSLFNAIPLTEGLEPLVLYSEKQKQNIAQNKKVLYFENDFLEYEDLLKLCSAVLRNKNEVYIRDFSIKLFGSSKRIEALESKVRSLLFYFGSFQDKSTVLEECNIIKTPTYIMVKGNALLQFKDTAIDLQKISGDIALSSHTLLDLQKVSVLCKNVFTVENLTSFHRFNCEDSFVIYLGGFHNEIKRTFLKHVARTNANIHFFHFGDIDAGGFYILEHLIVKTGIQFVPYNMDIKTLQTHKKFWLPLTDNDKIRIKQLAQKNNRYHDVLCFMLEHNCKLEQEALD